jgi:hypothetical protein
VAGVPVGACVAELERTVTQLGFLGCNLNLNPDPAGGYWSSPPLTVSRGVPARGSICGASRTRS